MANFRRPRRALTLSRRSVLLLLTIVSVFVLCNLAMYRQFYHSKILETEGIEHQKSAAIVFTLHSKYPTMVETEERPNKWLTRTLLNRDLKRLRSRAATISADGAASAVHKPVSALYDVDGNVFPDGLYYAAVRVGEPPKVYFLDMDTGSGLTWLNCDAPCQNCALGPNGLFDATGAIRVVDCREELCATVQRRRSFLFPHKCEEEEYGEWTPCDYYVRYADGSSSRGYLVSEYLTLFLSNGSQTQTTASIGCAYDQTGQFMKEPAVSDGMMGLSNSKAALPSQLEQHGVVENVIGQCLGSSGGNYLFLGEGLVPSSGMTWVPMEGRLHKSGIYQARVRRIWYGADELEMEDAVDDVAFDSGTSYSYLVPRLYKAVFSAVQAHTRRWGLVLDRHDVSLFLCWSGKFKFKSVSDAHQYFQTVTLDFGGGSALELRPEAYLFTSGKGNVCFGILDAKEDGGLTVTNVIGDISMRDYLIVFDNVRDEIGWVRKDCTYWDTGSP